MYPRPDAEGAEVRTVRLCPMLLAKTGCRRGGGGHQGGERPTLLNPTLNTNVYVFFVYFSVVGVYGCCDVFPLFANLQGEIPVR